MKLRFLQVKKLQNANLIFCSFIFIFLLIISAGCKKEIASSNINETAENASDSNKIVFTPAGPIPKSHTFLIENGFHLAIQNGHVYKVHTQSGRVVKDYGEIHSTGANLNGNVQQMDARESSNHINPPLSKVAQPNPYLQDQTYAQWDNTSGQTITYFSTNWVVPANPVKPTDGQLFFIFPALAQTPTSDIMQPALQWGFSAAGGGICWGIANWYVWLEGSTLYTAYSNMDTVLPGTVLQGVISWGVTKQGYNSYTSSFTGYSNPLAIAQGDQYAGLIQTPSGGPQNAQVTIPTVPIQVWAYEGLESYNENHNSHEVGDSADYPAALDVPMYNIIMKEGQSYASLNWTPETGEYNYWGEHTVVVSNNSSGSGDVELFFHHCQDLQAVNNATWTNNTLTLSWSPVNNATEYEVIINSGPGGSGAFYYTSATSIANFFNTIEANGPPGNYQVIINSFGPCGNGPSFYYNFQVCSNNLSQIQNPNWNNSTLTLSWSAVSGASQYEMIINSSPSGHDNGAFYYTTATSIPNFFNTIEANSPPGNYQVILIPQYACGNGPLLYYNFTH